MANAYTRVSTQSTSLRYHPLPTPPTSRSRHRLTTHGLRGVAFPLRNLPQRRQCSTAPFVPRAITHRHVITLATLELEDPAVLEHGTLRDARLPRAAEFLRNILEKVGLDILPRIKSISDPNPNSQINKSLANLQSSPKNLKAGISPPPMYSVWESFGRMS